MTRIISGRDPYTDAGAVLEGKDLTEAPPYDGGRVGVARHALDPEPAETLWALSEETTGVSL